MIKSGIDAIHYGTAPKEKQNTSTKKIIIVTIIVITINLLFNKKANGNN